MNYPKPNARVIDGIETYFYCSKFCLCPKCRSNDRSAMNFGGVYKQVNMVFGEKSSPFGENTEELFTERIVNLQDTS